ncbi:PHD finger protein ALFIN-LIKE 2-like [Brachypodium distachyon]|uniref:PHD finger protein ALFIN-LIKE 2-like n=1 Tax=Brachypodium distachyon TaxID=15368 RepID=UPI000234E575|nr:PHD finger protein ALFIN-LIKE 2-like [Brachypodium distachyon]|eukprot:XP_024314563.1 PHD finger protein ALFIN-LIKE 2-like [Brachypodium distachyon]
METPKTVLFNLEGVFEDFSTRRTALIRALTTDRDEFYGFCNSETEILCLYGHDDGSWEVKPPEPMVPTMLPEPMTGINLCRNDVSRVDWLSIVAIHSDAWLMSVSFFLGALLTSDERYTSVSVKNE